MIENCLNFIKSEAMDEYNDITIYYPYSSEQLQNFGFSFEYYLKYWKVYEENGKLILLVIGSKGFEKYGEFENEKLLFKSISNLYINEFDINRQIKIRL